MTDIALRLLRKLPKNNQKGFTLIEMLVVISILGILAAVVTISMIGVTNLAQDRANKAELSTVQVAMDTMASQQQVPTNGACPSPGPAAATKDMTNFPVPAAEVNARLGNPQPLFPNYIRQRTTASSYWCDQNGFVHSSSVSNP